MPTSVRTSLWLYCGSAVLAGFFGPLYPKFTVLAIPGLVLAGFIAYNVGRRRHWARVLLLVLTLLGLLAWLALWRPVHLLSQLGAPLDTPRLQWRLIPLVAELLQVIAAALLFTSPANRWFSQERIQMPARGTFDHDGDAPATKKRWLSSDSFKVARRWVLIPVALLALLFLADRALHIALHQLFGSSENPTKGDPQYPQANPNPTRFLDISGLMTSTLPASLDARYETRAPVYPVHDMTCFRTIFGYGPVSLSVSIPLKLQRDRNRFHATLTVDHYLPGPCGWHFVGLGIRPLKGPLGGDATFTFARASGDAPVNSGTGAYDDSLDLWCRYSPPSHFDAVITCWSLPEIRSDYPSLQSEPIVNDKTEVYVLPGTKSLTVNFHDISGDR
jgi:hypothetical protein